MATATGVRLRWGGADLAVVLALLALFALLVHWAALGPRPARPGALSLAYAALPRYALYSWLRMLAAYLLSFGFAIGYGYLAAVNRTAERYLIPLLDILQSVPVLSFLPVVLLAFAHLFPGTAFGPNLASIVLIFTGQAWNLVFAFYTAMVTLPEDLKEVAALAGLPRWRRFTTLELPFAAVGLVWNSMMSWAGGWFFLMAAEMFSLSGHLYQLEGLGSYLAVAAGAGRWGRELAGLATLVAVIVLMDQAVWRPLLAWAERFRPEGGTGTRPPRSALLRLVRRSALVTAAVKTLKRPLPGMGSALAAGGRRLGRLAGRPGPALLWSLVRTLVVAALLVAGAEALAGAWHLLLELPASAWLMVAAATGATFLRVLAALALSLAWTVPAGVLLGLNPRWAPRLAPLTQIAASVPATALFPGLVALLLGAGGGLSLAAVLLMVLGTQWYILFNVVAGASAIPRDLLEAARLLGLRGWRRWRILILPAVFPSLLTGLITAAGGAWNASIVAERVAFAGHVYRTFGVGALIARSSDHGRFALLLASTLALSLTVVLINRLVWHRLYTRASDRYAL